MLVEQGVIASLKTQLIIKRASSAKRGSGLFSVSNISRLWHCSFLTCRDESYRLITQKHTAEMEEENMYSRHSDLNFITRSCENRFFSITLLKSPTTFEQRNYQFERCNN